jgi:membrane protease YdiL (CAAX protease family)
MPNIGNIIILRYGEGRKKIHEVFTTHHMINNLFRFIVNPYISTWRKTSLKEFIRLLFVYVLLTIPLIILSGFVAKALRVTHVEFTKGSTLMILYGVFVGPILEEIIFRSWLKWTKRNIYILIATFLLFVGLSFFHHQFQQIYIMLFLLLLVVILTYLLKNIKVEPFINNHFKYFYWGSSIVFGLVHASNFIGNIWYLIGFSFILASPQIIGGFILGYIRMNNGLRYSILFHILVNSYLLLSLLHK